MFLCAGSIHSTGLVAGILVRCFNFTVHFQSCNYHVTLLTCCVGTGSVSSVIDRAGEQEKLNVNGTVTVPNGVNVTEELSLDFYLGIYAGQTPWKPYSGNCFASPRIVSRRLFLPP